jgi:hypothetical protein
MKKGKVFLLLIAFLLVGFVSAYVHIGIDFPKNNTWYNENISYFNWSDKANDDPLVLCEYNLNNTENKEVNCDNKSINFNSQLSDGNYSLEFFAKYSLWSSDGDEIKFYIDTIPPQVSITYPNENYNYSKVINQLNYTFTEKYPDKCWYSKDNGITNSTPQTCDESFNDITSQEGENLWIVYMNDSAGNENSKNVSFWVDSIEPNITLVTPLLNPFYSKNSLMNLIVNLNETNKGGYYQENYVIYIEYMPPIGPPVSSLCNLDSNNNSDSCTVDFSFNNEGNYNYTIKAKDIYPNKTTIREVNLTGKVIIDFTSPNITLNSPKNNSNHSTQLNINFTAVDSVSPISKLWVNLSNETGVIRHNETIFNNNLLSLTNTSFFNLSGLSDGEYNLSVSVFEKATNSNTTEIKITIDNTPPIVNITFPFNETYNENITQLNYTMIEKNPDSCWYFANNKNNSFKKSAENFTNVMSNQGENKWIVYCNDSVNNIGFDEVVFSMDTIKPEVENNSLEGTYNKHYFSPKNTDGFYDEIIIKLNSSEIVNWSTAYIYNESNEKVKTFYTEKNSVTYSRTWDGKNSSGVFLPTGNYTFNMTLTDKAGNENNFTDWIYIDNTPPEVLSHSIKSNGNYSGVIDLSANITEEIFEIKNVFFNISNLSFSKNYFAINNNGNYSYELNTNELYDGEYTISIIANDTLGNLINPQNMIIKIDNLAPSITSYNGDVNNNSYLSKVKKLNISVDDVVAGVKNVSFEILNSSFSKNYSAINNNDFWSADINTNEFSDGVYEIKINVNDNSGNSKNEFIKITIDNTPPSLIGNVFNFENGILNYVINLNAKDTTSKISCFKVNDTENFTIDCFGNLSNKKSLEIGAYILNVTINDSAGNINSSIITINADDFSSPQINLSSSLKNNQHFRKGEDVIINFSADDSSGLSNCSLILNGKLNQTLGSPNDNVVKNTLHSFNTLSNLGFGKYNWSVECVDLSLSFNKSTTPLRYFTILEEITNINNYNSTNITEVEDISNVSFFVENETYGKINYTSNIDFSSGKDWSKYITISHDKVIVDSDNFPELDRPATITMKNIQRQRLQILKDGVPCGGNCPVLSYSNGVLIFSVNSFSEYTTRDNPCGDGVCGAGETYSSCSADCEKPKSTGGSGGGGCVTKWICSNWSECANNTQERICEKERLYCSFVEKPIEVRDCTIPIINNSDDKYISPPFTIDDEIKGGSGVTGAVVGAPRNKVKVIFISGFLVLLAVIFALRLRKKSNFTFR